MLLSIITLNYKKPELTISCLESLQKEYKEEFENGTFELIVVDNLSEDDSVEKIKAAVKKENYKNTKVIANTENAGFGKGNNVGAKEAKGTHLLFLNNDTVAKDKGILTMAKYLDEHEEIAILGGQMKNFDGSLQQSTGKFFTPFYTVLLMFGKQSLGLSKSNSEIQAVDWVKGGLLMIRKSVFDKLQGFDEKIFMYIEDMELCYRAKKAGFATYFYPDVQVAHKEHGSASRTFAIIHIYKGMLYFYKKHRSGFEYVFIKSLLLSKAILAIMVGSILRNSYLVTTYKKAIQF